jgi:hypothetical protein
MTRNGRAGLPVSANCTNASEFLGRLAQGFLKEGKNELAPGLRELGNTSESITRRYEFDAYADPYDLEREVQIEDPADDPTAVQRILLRSSIASKRFECLSARFLSSRGKS